MEPKLRNCCKPEHVGTKENGKILERIQVLEDGRVAAKEARNWKIEGQKEESRGQNIRSNSNAIILHETLPAYCFPKVVRMETGEVRYERVFTTPRLPPKISLKHDWMKALGSEVARQTEGEVVQQSKSSQSSQPNPNPDHDRTVTPVVCRDTSHAQGASQTRSSHESMNFNVENETNHDRTVKPVVCRDANHEQSMLNEVDIDF